ncbi:hypothetical protein L208DRAFT_1376443 [Tricholoma matsutake]|nr:hypothetical protein L208DRAFT_1376443 [Tricholoma matsutake 945]
MAKKHQKAAAAHAQANRHKPKPSSPPTKLIPAKIIPELSSAGSSIDAFGNLTADIDINVIDVDWESDCGYEGGVSRKDSETEYQPESEDSETDYDESLDELSGDELEWNLECQQSRESFAEQVLFWSDISSSSSEDEFETSDDELGNCQHPIEKLDVPYRVQRQQRQKQKLDDLQKAHIAIKKLLASRKTKFVAGGNGLQIWWTRVIECYLWLKMKNGQSTQEAGEHAAESQGFAPRWGGRQVRSWAKVWVAKRELPKSVRGSHVKVRSLLDDPKVAGELRSNKWAINPGKLAQFSKIELIPSAADQYLCKIVRDEMPRGLKRYMEYELFPWIHLKVGRGISLSTARWWMHKEVFRQQDRQTMGMARVGFLTTNSPYKRKVKDEDFMKVPFVGQSGI